MELEGVFWFDCKVDVSKENIDTKQLLKILKHIKPTWEEISLVCQDLSGGKINLLLRCYQESNPEDSVVFRIWAPEVEASIEGMIDRKMETGLCHKLGKKGVAPKLFASFRNGLCFEYFDGEKVTNDLFKMEEVARSIAKNFAKIHRMRLDGYPLEPNVFTVINSAFKIYPFHHPEPEKDEILQKNIPTKEQIAEEIKFLHDYLKGLNSSIVQCHGDPHFQNMLYSKKTGQVIFVDYETAYIGYQPGDIAFFFLMQTVDHQDLAKGFRTELMPTEELQRKFLRWYLEEWFESIGKHSNDVTEENVNKLFIQTKYILFVYFHFAMCFLKICSLSHQQGFAEDIEVLNFDGLAMKYFKIYFEKKNYYLSLKIPDV